MKFRALLLDLSSIKEFSNIISALSKLAKEVVIKITIEKIYFIVCDNDLGPNRPLVWCELPKNYYFREYYMEGVSVEFNEIYLEFSPVLLARALKQIPRVLKLKLTSKTTPCLTVESELISELAQNQLCVHDIPVKIIPRRLWCEYKEPEDLNFNISIAIPNMKALKNIVDRLKTMSSYVEISANKNGRLSFTIETSLGSVCVHFPDLQVHHFNAVENNGQYDNDQLENVVSTRIDIKKFHHFLQMQQVNYTLVTFNIIHKTLLKIYFEQHGAFNIQSFLLEVSR